MEKAAKSELVSRNVVSVIDPPKVEAGEIEILSGEQVLTVLRKLEGHSIYSIIALGLATGLRRGELLALAWNHIDLDAATLKVERSLEQTREGGLRFKPPKTKYGKRTISLPPHALKVLRDHRRQQLENRLQMGLGKPAPEGLVFADEEGQPLLPNNMTRRRLRVPGSPAGNVPCVAAHPCLGPDRRRHRRGQDQPSARPRRPTVTLRTYAHLFDKVDTSAAARPSSAYQPVPARPGKSGGSSGGNFLGCQPPQWIAAR
jgi:integrase